ncbi:MAG: glycosyltransferase subfamily GT2 protein [Bacteroidetes bacterium]|nr:glycosyltransferase subfamily GT2 protein [Bacteroidota bacterium]
MKIGIGVITCNRLELFRRCIASIPAVDMVVVVNDGDPYAEGAYPSHVHKVIQHPKRSGVASAKNDAFRALLEAGCDHLFLCEDDIEIVSADILHDYIRAARTSGIEHFNYAFHGPMNNPDLRPDALGPLCATYPDGVAIKFYRHPIGAFSYFSRNALETAGLFDLRFRNFHDHTDHTMQIIKAGLHPPYGWFADIAESRSKLNDLDPQLHKSTSNRRKLSYTLKYYYYLSKYIYKNGPVSIRPLSEVITYLRTTKPGLDIRISDGNREW